MSADEERDATMLEQLADYECPECGELADQGYTELEAADILGGDERGFLRCPECGEVLEPTLGAALAMLELVERRMGGSS